MAGYHNCTTLLGITCNHAAAAGIVHEIFIEDGEGALGNLHWGVVGSGLCMGSPGLKLLTDDVAFSVHDRGGKSKPVQKILEEYNTEAVKVGGRGKQLLGVLTGRFSAVVCDVSDGKGCSAWDIAANTALFQACGLDLVKVEDGKPYQFVPLDQFDAVKYKNRQPFVAASNPELQRKVLLSMQKYSAEEQ